MKKYVSIFASALLALLTLSCGKEEAKVAKAVLGDVNVMNFTATAPEAQTLTVVSDGPWQTTAPDWVTVTPSSGNGETLVTVTVSENKDEIGLLEPRTGKIYLAGNTIASRHTILVSQEGDSYRNAEHLNLSEIVALSDGKSFILDQATVAAITQNGFVVTDGTVNLYVKGEATLTLGDKVSLKGLKGTENGVAMVNTMDGCTVLEAGTVEYPTPVDLTTGISTYAATSIDYVTVSGIVSAGALVVTVDEVQYAVKLIDPTETATLAALNGHKATVLGYSYGLLGAKMLGVLATSVKDDGINEVIYFQDDFEWMAPYATAAGAPDDVANNSVGSTPNIFTSSALSPLLAEFQSRGYGYLWGGKGLTEWSFDAPASSYQTLYLAKNYLKFGKSDVNAGIVLPAMSAVTAPTDVILTFDWCWCMTGKKKPDIMTLTAEVKDGESSEVLTSTQPTEGNLTKLEWQHATVVLKNVSATDRIVLRPTNVDPYVSNKDRGQNRWYLDNIKVVPANGGSGEDPNAPKLPVSWKIQVEGHNYATTWPLANGSATEEGVSGYIAPVEGEGSIWYNNEAGNAADKASGKKKTKLDIQALDPRVTGAWPGDYCQFKVPGSVAVGKSVRISFETRTSATNPKYWKLIYLDGTDWKAAAEVKTATVEGATVEYTHAMNSDGSTNTQVDATVTYASKTDGIVFRFVCQSAMGAGGDMLAAPNGGTWRLAVTDATSDDWQPRIQWAF